MTYKNLIPGCFGDADKIFAGHTCDAERAKNMLRMALDENVSYRNFNDAIRAYLTSENCSDNHIADQLKRVSDLSNYF